MILALGLNVHDQSGQNHAFDAERIDFTMGGGVAELKTLASAQIVVFHVQTGI